MGKWTAEAREESACLRRALGRVQPRTNGRGPAAPQRLRVNSGVGFAFPVSEAPHVMAVLNQILAHPAYQEWLSGHDSAKSGWELERVDDLIRLYGPVAGADGGEPWRTTGTVELPYANLESLRIALMAAL